MVKLGVPELAEVEVAMGDQGAHAEFDGQNHGRVLVRFGRRHTGTLIIRRDLAQEPEDPRLTRPHATLARPLKRLVGDLAGVDDAAGPQVALAQHGRETGGRYRAAAPRDGTGPVSQTGGRPLRR